MSDDLVEAKLARPFASVSELATAGISEQYERLNDLAHEGAKKVSNRCESLNRAWDELMPTLHQMQSLLSQRGADRGLQTAVPTWISWLKRFLKDSGLAVTMRTVQGRLANFRHRGKPSLKPADRPLKLTSRDQRKLLAAAQCGNELIAALDAGADYHPAMEEYRRIAIGQGKIEQLLESAPAESLPATRPQQLSPAGATESSATPVRSEPKPPPTAMPVEGLPKAGNWDALVDYVCNSCGEGFKSTLQGLDSVTAANCLQSFARKLEAMYCVYNRLDGQIEGNVKYVRADLLPTKRAA